MLRWGGVRSLLSGLKQLLFFSFFPPPSQRSLSKVHQLQNFILETEKHSYLGKHTAFPGTRRIAQCLEEKKQNKNNILQEKLPGLIHPSTSELPRPYLTHKSYQRILCL